MESGIRWTAVDRDGNDVYLTEERWQHIVGPTNHPEMEDFEEELRQTIQYSRRQQDPLNPQKYTYTRAFHNLVEDNTHIVAVVLFRFRDRMDQSPVSNNYVVTAYLKEIG